MPKLNPGEAVVRMDVSTNLNSKFDVIQNCKLAPRRSDVGVLQDEMMLTRRDGLVQVGTMPSVSVNSDGVNGVTFYTGTNGVRSAYKFYSGEVHKVVVDENGIAGTWTKIADVGGEGGDFMKITLPHGNKSTTFTSSGLATGIEKLKRNTTSDTSPLSNIGKYVYITGSITPTTSTYNIDGVDAYRNKYSFVSGYDATNNEYLLGELGNATALASGVRYVFFDKLDEYLLIMSNNGGSTEEKFYDGTSFEPDFDLRITSHFQRMKKSNVVKLFQYDGFLWAHDGHMLFRSEAKNYLFFPLTGVIDHSKIDDINETFVWKSKMIVGGPSSITVYKRLELEGQLAYQPDVISDSYGIKMGGVNNFEKDVYVFTTNNELISLSENQYGVVLPTNVGKPMLNYVKDFRTYITSGFDGRKFYLYGKPNNDLGAGVAIVYDTVGKFWSTYTGIPFSRIITEGDITYVTFHDDNRLCRFSRLADNDLGATIVQTISTVPITAGDPFILKEHTATGFWFENPKEAIATFKIYHHYSTNGRNGTLRYNGDDTRRYDGVKLTKSNNTDYVTGVSMPIPFMLKKKGTGNPANVWKITLVADGSNTVGPSGTALGEAVGPIELNELYFTYKTSNTDYNRTDFSF